MTRRMPSYTGWNGQHFRECRVLRVIGTWEDMQRHLEECNPETCELPHSCDCADRDEAAYWQEVDRRIDEQRDRDR